tara:strand:- start:3988 stop:4128 length:141 start_codon:yes stop_codon:yes gene_type:complete
LFALCNKIAIRHAILAAWGVKISKLAYENADMQYDPIKKEGPDDKI